MVVVVGTGIGIAICIGNGLGVGLGLGPGLGIGIGIGIGITISFLFKVRGLRSETLAGCVLLRSVLRSQTLVAKCCISVKVSLRSGSLPARARQPDWLPRFPVKPGTLAKTDGGFC